MKSVATRYLHNFSRAFIESWLGNSAEWARQRELLQACCAEIKAVAILQTVPADDAAEPLAELAALAREVGKHLVRLNRAQAKLLAKMARITAAVAPMNEATE